MLCCVTLLLHCARLVCCVVCLAVESDSLLVLVARLFLLCLSSALRYLALIYAVRGRHVGDGFDDLIYNDGTSLEYALGDGKGLGTPVTLTSTALGTVCAHCLLALLLWHKLAHTAS